MRFFLCIALAAASLGTTAQNTTTPPATGHSIEIQVKPYQNQWIYLAYYYGGIKALADSVLLNAESIGVFSGPAPLSQGIYIVASPSKTILFEMLVPEQQQFSVSMDTLDMEGSLRFTNSKENDLFLQYTAFLTPHARSADDARQKMETAASEADKKALQQQIDNAMKAINDYRVSTINQNPESLLALIFKTMQETPLPTHLRMPKTRKDSIEQYYFVKEHYWENFDFMDGRLVRTPIFENKLKTYLNNWVLPDADSIIYEQNWMMALGRNDPEMSRYLISYFIDNYMYPKIMGQDKVFLNTYEKYVAGDNPLAAWLNEKQKKAITERAYMVMANQLGGMAYDMNLVDTANKARKLYDVKSDYIVINFWDPNCGKCREELPKLDSLYQSTWKKQNVQIYAVMVNEDAVNEWKPAIQKHGKGWIHVHQTRDMRAAEEKAQQPNFRQLYDMRSTPTLFLLDKDKRIIAKNLGLEDLHNVLQQKITKGS